MLKLIGEYKYYSNLRFSTLSGTLVYFLIMSVTPFLFWVALISGNADFSEILSYEAFSAAEPVITFLQQSAQSATGGAGIILLATSLWSSTNFFYHLRRSGEIIYTPAVSGSGIKLRIMSLFAVFAAIISVAAIAAVPFIGVNVLEIIMPRPVAEAITFTFIVMFAFFTACFLNAFACPLKATFSDIAGGALFTVILWILCAAAFSVYLKFASPQKLYGAVAAIIVFLLWCYLMINSLVIGIIYNKKYFVGRGMRLNTL